MARMIPSTPRDFHGSRGEERVFYALRGLPDEVTVIHSFRWLHPGQPVSARLVAQGEGDFVLFDPSRGVVVIEVKGGDIWCENGEWRQRNRRTGEVVPINPEAQASNTVHRIRQEIVTRLPAATSFLFCHAVWFPDGVVDRTCLPMNCPAHIVLDGEDVAGPAQAIGRVFSYWHQVLPGRRGVSPKDATNLLAALAPTFSVVRSVRQTLDEREDQFVQLTREQARVVHYLDEQRHAAIHGAAGTGKTLVAIEKARRLATSAEPVLFLCYNAALKTHLERNHAHPNVHYATFHGLTRQVIGGEGTLDQAERRFLDHLIDDGSLPYTHLIVDEGQDFEPEWLEHLSLRFRAGVFYVFYDRNQLVQARDAAWLDEIPCRLTLTRNCRNTDQIAKVAYRAARLSVVPTLGVIGPRPLLHVVADENEAIARATALSNKARAQKVEPHDIAILTLDTLPEDSTWRSMHVGGRQVVDAPAPGSTALTTVRRFKGLEARLVIIANVDFSKAEDADWRRRLYVGCSRARHAVHLITTNKESALGTAVAAFADTEKVRANWRSLSRILGLGLAEGEDHDPFEEPRAGRV